MRSVLLVWLLGLPLIFGLGVLIATSDDSLESFDLHRPATLLGMAESRLREIQSHVRRLLRDLLDEFTAPYHERLHRTLPTEPLPR